MFFFFPDPILILDHTCLVHNLYDSIIHIITFKLNYYSRQKGLSKEENIENKRKKSDRFRTMSTSGEPGTSVMEERYKDPSDM